MLYLYSLTGLAVLISLVSNRDKTWRALKIAFTKLLRIMPAFLTMLIFISVILYLVPDTVIIRYLGGSNRYVGVVLASLFGSITVMPGFIAFPLSGILLDKGVSYMVLSAFTTTLMMVGILTFPVEKEYFGFRVALIRNVISFVIAMVVALSVGYFFGELT